MSLIDRTILEWAWMSEKGYPDLNNENDLKVFESMFGFNLKEAQTGKATLFESALVQAWYTVNKKEIPEGAIDPKEFAKLKSNPEMVKSQKRQSSLLIFKEEILLKVLVEVLVLL